jgi:hypothetical protein
MEDRMHYVSTKFESVTIERLCSQLVFTEPRQGSDVEKVIAKLGDLRAQGLQTDIERASSGPTNITAGIVRIWCSACFSFSH